VSVIESHSSLRPRIAFFYAVVGVAILVLAAGLAYRQLFSNEAFTERERLQNQRRVLLPGPRGEIFDREGRVLVANRSRFSAAILFSDQRVRREFSDEQFRLVRDSRRNNDERPSEGFAVRARFNVVQRYLDECGRILGRRQPLDARVLERHFSQQPLLPFPLISDLASHEFAALVEQLPAGSPIEIHAVNARHYPYGSAAAHTLGFVVSTDTLPDEGLPGGDLKTFFTRGSFGREGLELQFDERLQGQTGSEIWIVDNSGIRADRVGRQAPIPGKPLYTSLDVDLQLAGEEAFGDREGALVMLDVQTGEVLAMVSKPDYDLNKTSPFITTEYWNSLREQEALYNRATQGCYPPGSPFKLVTAIAALRAGVITPETEFVCNGTMAVGKAEFKCHAWRRGGHGRERLLTAIRDSCNIYFYNAALAAGPDALAAEARRFGLDRQTGIELPAEEKRMLIPDPAWKLMRKNESWTGGDTANMAIGQGFLLVTPLQMACFAASLARGETSTQPTLLRRESGVAVPVSGNQMLGLSPSDRAVIMEGMRQVVNGGGGVRGTGHFAKLPDVEVSGKTGTAQVRTPRGTLELAWFLAFAPSSQPKVAVALIVVGDEPDELNAGGMVAAPRAKKVLEAYFKKHPPATAAPTLTTR
jgi:penicillin-binding protein 2